jgi:hypothetical protein
MKEQPLTRRPMSETPKNDAKNDKKPWLFKPGNKAGHGRPQGSRNSATIALQALLDSEGEQVTRKCIELALAGDSTAMRLVIERLLPPTKERHLNLSLPRVEVPQDVTAATSAVLEAVASGAITPSEGQAVQSLIESQRKSIETLALEARLAAIEQAIALKK